MTATRTFASVSEAVGYAVAVVLHRGDIRKPKPTHGGPPPDDEAAIAVLQAMRTAGCEYDSDAGRSIIAWATAPDDVGEGVDGQARSLLTDVLEAAGLVVRPPPLPPVAWRAHEFADGRRVVTCCCVQDDGVRASKAEALAGPAVRVLVSVPSREQVRAEVLEMLAASVHRRDVDARVMLLLRCSARQARKLRSRWAREASA
jgi:hypothetical protein